MAFGLDDIFSAGVGLVGNLVSGGMNNQAAEDRQNSANAFSAQQYATRYQTTVKDMEAAGLNPMLAYSQGAGSAPSGAVSNAAPYSDMGQSMNQSRVASAQIANVQADTRNKEAQADLIAAQAAQAWSSAGQSNANIGLINANANKVIEETKNIPVEGDRLRYAIQLLAEQASKTAQEGETQVALRRQIAATIAKVQLDTKLSGLDLQAAENLGNLGRSAGELKPWVDMVINVLRVMRPGGGGITINK